MTSTQDKAISAARGEVGYKRKSNRYNKYAAEVYPSVQNQAYCGVFVTWAYLQAGVDLRKWCWMPYCPTIASEAKKIGAWKTSGQKDGDLVLYDWGDNGRYRHVGIVWRDEHASGRRAVEGNTSASSSGSQGNGGAVAVRYRGAGSIAGYVDMDKVLAHLGVSKPAAPVVDSAKPTSGALEVDGVLGRATAQEVQQRLGVTVDGRIGPDTIKAWQGHERTPVDGKITGQNSYCKGKWPAARSDCFVIGTGGSRLIRTVQTNLRAGLKVDGLAGDSFVKALQRALNESEGTLR